MRPLAAPALLALLWLPAFLPAETPREAVDRYTKLTLGEKGTAVSSVNLGAGHMQIRLAQGVAAPVLAGTETIGFFFRGSGSWEYFSETPEEFAVLVRNAKDVSHWKPAIEKTRATLKDEFSEMLWIAAGTEKSALAGGETAPPASEFRKHLERFSRLQTDSIAQRLAYRTLAASASRRRLEWGQFTGGKNETLFVNDAVVADREALCVLKKLETPGFDFEGEYGALPISAHPISHPFREARRGPIDLSRVEVNVEADGETAKIRSHETFIARDEPLSVLWLDLRSRFWEGNRRDPRFQRLLHVRTSSGAELPFDHRRGTLIVALPAPVAPGQSITLEFESGGDILYRPAGDSYWLLGFDNWYPNPGLGASTFTWLCEVKVKKPFVPLASGTELERRTEGDWNIVRTEFTEPVFLPIVMAGKYQIQEEIRNGRKIRIAGYAFAHERAAKQMINLAGQIIEFYEVFLGPFPWKELTIIEINDYGYGVAPPGTMFITQEAFSPIRDTTTRYFSKGLNERYAHEIAHQYWGHQIKWAAPEHEWLSESFAEYCAALFVRRLRGESAYKDMVAYWRAHAKDVGERATIATANRVLGERGFEDRTDLLYNKGPYVLSVLHRRLGEEKFLTALKTFQSGLKGKFGSTALFQNLLEFVDKKSYAEFFDQNVWDIWLPEPPK
jgi:hypothetical protein